MTSALWGGSERSCQKHTLTSQKREVYILLQFKMCMCIYILLYLSSRLSLLPLAWLHLVLLVLPLPHLAACTPQLVLLSRVVEERWHRSGSGCFFPAGDRSPQRRLRAPSDASTSPAAVGGPRCLPPPLAWAGAGLSGRGSPPALARPTPHTTSSCGFKDLSDLRPGMPNRLFFPKPGPNSGSGNTSALAILLVGGKKYK